MSDEQTDEPPYLIGIAYRTLLGTSSGQASEAAAFDAAVAAMTVFADWAYVALVDSPGTLFSFAHITRTGATYNGSVKQIEFKWIFAVPYCYLKLWWKEYFSEDGGSSTTTNDKEIEWDAETSVGGLCLPADFDYTDPETWCRAPADVQTLAPVMPSVDNGSGGLFDTETDLNPAEAVFALVKDYEPPDDGSANGFPV